MLITNVDFQVSKRLLHLFTYKTQRNERWFAVFCLYTMSDKIFIVEAEKCISREIIVRTANICHCFIYVVNLVSCSREFKITPRAATIIFLSQIERKPNKSKSVIII